MSGRQKGLTPEETIERLEQLLREARGVLGDLAHERKAVETVARVTVEKAIVDHVNNALKELASHLDVQMVLHEKDIRKSFATMLEAFCGTHATQRTATPDRPSLPEILAARDVMIRADHYDMVDKMEDLPGERT